eukprot:9690493-Lingulodinium_polyedra.AAC.1
MQCKGMLHAQGCCKLWGMRGEGAHWQPGAVDDMAEVWCSGTSLNPASCGQAGLVKVTAVNVIMAMRGRG